jgi:demethylmenaquinone methyltransferase/2-methoxy-6-polyprenyl-1,4-benzoquinol methylase
MFDGIARRYDLLNDLLSLGLDRWWRRAAAKAILAGPGDLVLDLGCGTGKLGALLTRRATVVGVDLSHAMLLRVGGRGPACLLLVQGSAFRLPFADARFDAAVSGFLLRNLNDLGLGFAELARAVRAGGTVALVDITEPPGPLLRRLFDVYFRIAAPALGGAVGKREAYSYLVRSLSHLPPPREVSAMMDMAGFEGCLAKPLSGGIATLFTGTRR